MIKETIKEQSIQHYDRMIEWVKMQPSDDHVYWLEMVSNLNNSWGGESCAYCKEYRSGWLSHCGRCPLHTEEGCCDGLWAKMNRSKNWKQWLYWAYRVRAYIKKNG